MIAGRPLDLALGVTAKLTPPPLPLLRNGEGKDVASQRLTTTLNICARTNQCEGRQGLDQLIPLQPTAWLGTLIALRFNNPTQSNPPVPTLCRRPPFEDCTLSTVCFLGCFFFGRFSQSHLGLWLSPSFFFFFRLLALPIRKSILLPKRVQFPLVTFLDAPPP